MMFPHLFRIEVRACEHFLFYLKNSLKQINNLILLKLLYRKMRKELISGMRGVQPPFCP